MKKECRSERSRKSIKKEEELKSEEELNEKTKIKKDSKILIEVKQNTSLNTLYNQMKEVMEDLKILLPKENFYYFGFVNDNNINKINLGENDLIEIIKKYEIMNPNFKIFLFIIKTKLYSILN